MGGNLDSGSKRNEGFDFSYRQQNKFEEKMLKKHGVNMNEKYHVYDQNEKEAREAGSPVVLKLRPDQENMPLTPPELRKGITVDNVENYQD